MLAQCFASGQAFQRVWKDAKEEGRLHKGTKRPIEEKRQTPHYEGGKGEDKGFAGIVKIALFLRIS